MTLMMIAGCWPRSPEELHPLDLEALVAAHEELEARHEGGAIRIPGCKVTAQLFDRSTFLRDSDRRTFTLRHGDLLPASIFDADEHGDVLVRRWAAPAWAVREADGR